MPNNAVLRKELAKATAVIRKRTKAEEVKLGKAYIAAYDVIRTKALDLWAKLGDPPTLAEMRRYNRLLSLMDSVKIEYAKLNNISTRAVTRNSEFGFTEAAYRAQYAIDKATGILIAFPKIPVGAVRASVYNADLGMVFSSRLLADKNKNIRKIEQTITQALVLGENSTKAAKRIQDAFAGGYSDAVRVLRTESTRNATQGMLQTFDDAEKAGVEIQKVWIAALDDRTRDAHADLDEKYADKDGLFHSGGYSAEGPGLFGVPELDINCRCTVVADIEGLSSEIRREGGGGIIDDMSYDDWLNR